MQRSVVVLAALLTLAAGCKKARQTVQLPEPPAIGEPPAALATDSAAEAGAAFTQAFYDWYAEHHTSLEDAVRLRPEVFAPGLLRALQADIAAARRNPGEVVGLDWDPFTGSQDPCLPMKVDLVTRRADTLLVMMRGQCTDQPSRSSPDAIPELLPSGRGWTFVDIRHGADRGTLLQDLAQLRASRDSAGRGR